MNQLEEGLLGSCERTVREAKHIVLFRIPAHVIRQDVPFPKAHLGGIDREPQAFFTRAQRLYRRRKFSFYAFQPGVLLSQRLEIAKQLFSARSHLASILSFLARRDGLGRQSAERLFERRLRLSNDSLRAFQTALERHLCHGFRSAASLSDQTKIADYGVP